MSDAALTPARVEAMIARLAEMDLAAAEKAHAKLMAAEETAEIADLGRTYQRMSRALRQTLALNARLIRDSANELARATILGRRDAFDREFLTEERTLLLQDGVARVAEAATPDREAREALLDRFDVELDDWIEAEDFLTTDLGAQVLRACRELGLPEHLARQWRQLPRDVRPAEPEPAATAPVSDEAPGRPILPRRDSG